MYLYPTVRSQPIMHGTTTKYGVEISINFFFLLCNMSYGSSPYTQPPPGYDEEAHQPLMGSVDDMYKETVANSSLEIRLRMVFYTLTQKKSV